MSRLSVLLSHLASSESIIVDDDLEFNLLSGALLVNPTAASAGPPRTIRISDVTLTVTPSETPFKVPMGYLIDRGRGESQESIRALRFLAQKDSLGQDVYLIGPPGSIRRRLVKKYCELTKRAVEYVALSNDTTEADLKQRREYRGGAGRYGGA